jgi:hypothetical protein
MMNIRGELLDIIRTEHVFFFFFFFFEASGIYNCIFYVNGIARPRGLV